MEAVVERENMKAAYARVKSNRGAAGVDGMSRLRSPNRQLAARARAVSVPVVTLDERFGPDAPAPDWLVMDIEGFEPSSS